MGKISLLLDRGADPRYRVQNYGSCLHYAILGSSMESPEGLRDSLILLVKNGADVYSRDTCGCSVSDIACEPKTEWRISPTRRQDNRNLQLQEIWAEALTACGYDAEEVMSSSIRVEESSESDDNVSENEDDVASQEEDDVITHGQDDELSLNDRGSPGSSETFHYPKHQSQYSNLGRQTDPALYNNYDWSVLEDDANVWKS